MKNHAMKYLKNLWVLPARKGVFFAVLFVAAGVSTLLALMMSLNERPEVHEPSADTQVVARLNELTSQVKIMEEVLNKPAHDINLNGVTAQIAELSSRLTQLREADSKKLTETLTHTQNALGEELHSIKEVVTHLDDKKSPIKYLPLKSLPFAVVSIDSIQQVPVASVMYDYKTMPLEKGDALAGWKVVRVDYGKQRLEFENAKSERVLITHEHIG
jgi:hypothetical protein